MKTNEWFLTILQLAAPIFCFSVGLTYQGWFLIAWIAFFGVTEWLMKIKTGKTLSQWVWEKPLWVRHVLGALMTLGMAILWYHFAFGGGQ